MIPIPLIFSKSIRKFIFACRFNNFWYAHFYLLPEKFIFETKNSIWKYYDRFYNQIFTYLNINLNA